MTGRLSIAGFLGITAAVVVLATIVAIALPHAPYIRYQSFGDTIFKRLSWTYERLAFDDAPIDVLVVGSSRSARGANVPLLEAALAEAGVTATVANISEPAAGMDIRLTKVREALTHHPEIQLIVLGIVETLPRDGHQAFGKLATAGEVLSSPWFVNRLLPANLARLPYRQMELSLASALPEAYGYNRAYSEQAYLGAAPDHRLFEDPDWTAEAEARITESVRHALDLEADSATRRDQLRPPVLPDALGWAEFGVSRHAIREIAALAEANGTDLAFLFLPFYGGYDTPTDADWLARFGPVWRAGFLKDDPRNYADTAHASQKGVEAIAPWLAGEIATHLKETGQ